MQKAKRNFGKPSNANIQEAKPNLIKTNPQQITGGYVKDTKKVINGARGLRMKDPKENTGGGKITQSTYDFAKIVQDNIKGFNQFTAFNDEYHTKLKYHSKHLDGIKFDFVINGGLNFDSTLLEAKKNERKNYLKKNILSSLEFAKEKALNQEIELETLIGTDKEKVIFVSDSYSRRLFIDNLSFIKILDKDKFKIRVRNSKNQLIFIEIKEDLIKKISENLFNTIEQVELIEQTVLQGLDKYTLEQLEQLNVYEFFEN